MVEYMSELLQQSVLIRSELLRCLDEDFQYRNLERLSGEDNKEQGAASPSQRARPPHQYT